MTTRSPPYAPTYPNIMLYDSHITLAPLDCPRMIRSCYLELKTPNTFWKKTFSTEGFATSYNVALVLFGYRLYLQCRWWHSRCGGNRIQSFLYSHSRNSETILIFMLVIQSVWHFRFLFAWRDLSIFTCKMGEGTKCGHVMTSTSLHIHHLI